MVSVHAEPTFERLRYSLGGDRPSQTAHLTMSPDQIHGHRLEFQQSKSGIPRTTPQNLTALFPSLPLILYINYRNPISSCSEAPWGLSVLSQVTGIFTGTTISPGGQLRYLRTVIVTAAVYRGFNSMLAHLLLTFRHRAGVSSYTSSFDLAETCVFDKQLPEPILCGSFYGAPLFPKLRGQFAEFLNYPSPVGLRILFLSTCVGLRYGHLKYSHSFSRLRPGILPYSNFGPLRPGKPTPGLYPFKVSLCLNFSVVTEYQPFVHRLRLSA